MGMSVRSLYRQTEHGEIKQWKKRLKYPPKVRCEAGATREPWKRVLSLSPILGKMFPQVHGLLDWTSRSGQIRHLLEVLGVISHHWPMADSTCFPHSVRTGRQQESTRRQMAPSTSHPGDWMVRSFCWRSAKVQTGRLNGSRQRSTSNAGRFG